MDSAETYTAFSEGRLLAAGGIDLVAARIVASDAAAPILIFEDATGRAVELDLRHGAEHAVAEFRARTSPPAPPPRQGRGRPKLGVVPREVTLLPRHWDWLATQPGGASAALRRLVEDARRANEGGDRERLAREAAYRVMSALAGDLPGFEEASRALFAGDPEELGRRIAAWPSDMREYVLRLASAF